ncbi:hypothetical protein NE237_022410 [Protea cynaroides]|uniref:AP2/ERF domain-containing protein n=1 Tax=Protea cynaroides TaxID=273540 RepID=A0A9Q0HC09_9MAGN|nr:hypothetical protein NE237_022410 [Protea cynaroides]
MAASTYDVAVLALKGADVHLNFLDSVPSYRIPVFTSPSDIHIVATAASPSRMPKPVTFERPAMNTSAPESNVDSTATPTAVAPQGEEEFSDKEALYKMPKLLVNMAKGMLMTPPRINSPPSDDDSSGGSDADSL